MDFVPAEIPIFDVARQHAGVSVVGVGGCALGRGGPADDHLGFHILHRGEFHVEVWAAVKQHLWFGDKVAVVRVILPLVSVLVTAPLVGRGHVVLHWPDGRGVVVEVVVQVEQTRIDGGVRVVHGHAFKRQIAWCISVPNLDDDAVLDEDGAVVVDGAGIVHRDHAAGQHVGARMEVIQGGVTPQAGDGCRNGRVLMRAWCGGIVLPQGSVVQWDVGLVPPAVLVGPAHRVDQHALGGAKDRTVSTIVVQFDPGVCTEHDDAGVGFEDGVPRQSARR